MNEPNRMVGDEDEGAAWVKALDSATPDDDPDDTDTWTDPDADPDAVVKATHDVSDEARDSRGRWTAGGGSDYLPADAADRSARDEERESERHADKKAARAKAKKAATRDAAKHVRAAGAYVDQARRRRVLKAVKNEKELSDAIGGFNLPDSEPADVVLIHDHNGNLITDHKRIKQQLLSRAAAVASLATGKAHFVGLFSGRIHASDRDLTDDQREHCERTLAQVAHFIEVKTLLTSAKGEVRMNKKALARKLAWEKKYHVLFHTVVLDDRKGAKHSGHRVHWTPDVGSTLKLANMHRPESLEHVKSLLTTGA